jgi:hypothetical protein
MQYYVIKRQFLSSKSGEQIFHGGQYPLRDSVTRFSTSGCFHQTIPPGPLIHRLKPFCMWLRGAQAGLFDEKTRGQKSCDTVPLTNDSATMHTTQCKINACST